MTVVLSFPLTFIIMKEPKQTQVLVKGYKDQSQVTSGVEINATAHNAKTQK